jgi:Leucine-rich repeat (LRR) protein
MYYNNLSGSIPPELGNLTYLDTLSLSTNSLSGSIPVELSKLTNLTALEIGYNSLTGPLPQWLSDLSIAFFDYYKAFTTSPANVDNAEPSQSAPNSNKPTEEWPSPYSGVTPDSSFGLAFNNIGVFDASEAKIYTCIRVVTEGLQNLADGISQFDVGLELVPSLTGVTLKIAKFREFNAFSALNEDGQTPDCSGKFETTTGVYTDIIQTDASVLETTWSLIDPLNLILKLDSFKELTAN